MTIREMAERLTAEIGTKEYGGLTARLALRYDSAIVRRVPREVFFPPPEIDSAFLRMTRRVDAPSAIMLAKADALIQTAFSQRRKQARRLLAKVASPTAITSAFGELQLPDTVRAEEISPRQYLEMAKILLALE